MRLFTSVTEDERFQKQYLERLNNEPIENKGLVPCVIVSMTFLALIYLFLN